MILETGLLSKGAAGAAGIVGMVGGGVLLINHSISSDSNINKASSSLGSGIGREVNREWSPLDEDVMGGGDGWSWNIETVAERKSPISLAIKVVFRKDSEGKNWSCILGNRNFKPTGKGTTSSLIGKQLGELRDALGSMEAASGRAGKSIWKLGLDDGEKRVKIKKFMEGCVNGRSKYEGDRISEANILVNIVRVSERSNQYQLDESVFKALFS